MMAALPTTKKIGLMTVSVDQYGYPNWTRIGLPGTSIGLSHEEAHDLLYAMQRIVTYLDDRKAEHVKRGIEWS